MSNKSEREYRAMSMAIEQRAEGDQESMMVSGYASTFNDPYLLWGDDEVEVWEQVDAHAFDGTDMSDVIMQYDHQGRVFARIRNNTLEVSPDDKGLFIRADLSGTEIGRGLYEEIAGGYTDRMSFGFTVDEDENVKTTEDDGRIKVMRTITKVGKLFDVSAVSLPANPGTVISARNLEGVIEEARAERLKALELQEKRQALIDRAKKVIEED